jgi:hypothetical protein
MSLSIDDLPDHPAGIDEGTHAYILERGQPWPTGDRPRPIGLHKGHDKACFRNAGRLVLDKRFPVYVEGYATTRDGWWVHHAWCADENGVVVETTWRELGGSYFGVAMTARQVAEQVVAGAQWGEVLAFQSQSKEV